MATSTLLQTGEQAPVLDKGHGTDALGPSDTSDSGSDLQGGHGLVMDEDLGLDTGTNEDATHGGNDAGPDIGDARLDSDSDSGGSGERASAGRDSVELENSDIYPDHVENLFGSEGDLDESAAEIADEVDLGTNQTDIDRGPRGRRSR